MIRIIFAASVMLLARFGECRGPETPTLPVLVDSVFKVDVAVTGSEASVERMILDTGSTHTWIFHYQIIQQVPDHRGGGYSPTRLRTRIATPPGGNRVEYADDGVVEAKVWTKKQFTINKHSWMQTFGIVEKSEQRGVSTISGLIGASRVSQFTKEHPVFGFKPHSQVLMAMNIGPTDVKAECKEGEMMYFPFSSRLKLQTHWAADAIVTFGQVRYHEGVVFDSGASVIALPLTAFAAFARMFSSKAVDYVHFPKKLHGMIDCSGGIDSLPTWHILSADRQIDITPQMYIKRLTRSKCIVEVSHISDGLPIVMGLPLLQNVVSEFNSVTRRIGLCRPVKSFITDYDGLTGSGPSGRRYYDCPSCSSTRGLSASAPATLLFLAAAFTAILK